MVDDPTVEALIERLADRLVRVPGVCAVVLGGSRARGTARSDSDVDLGLYYEPEAEPDVDALRALAREVDDRGVGAEVTAPGAWGVWANGGGWLEIDAIRVDWIYRDLARVERVIAECREGRMTSDYYLGHPHGFHSPIYAGEIHHARVLRDPGGRVAALRERVAAYPPALRAELVRRFLFDAEFMLEVGRKPALRGDVFQAAGCLFRTAAALVQVLFARNERWFLNEKGAVAEVDAMPVRPEDFRRRVETLLGEPGRSSGALASSFGEMAALVEETRSLAGS